MIVDDDMGIDDKIKEIRIDEDSDETGTLPGKGGGLKPDRRKGNNSVDDT